MLSSRIEARSRNWRVADKFRGSSPILREQTREMGTDNWREATREGRKAQGHND